MSLKNGGSPLVATAYSYDGMSRLASVGGAGVPPGVTASYTRLPGSSLLSSTNFTNGSTNVMTVARSYDNLNRLTSIASLASKSFSYVYNDRDQRTRCTFADGSYWEYAYDDLGQVTSGVKHFADGTPVPAQAFEYTFDPIGNRTECSVGIPACEYSYTSNSLNQYSQRTVPGVVPVLGEAAADTIVKILVGDQVTVAGRDGKNFRSILALDNSSSSIDEAMDIFAYRIDSQNRREIVERRSGRIFIPKTPEQFTYDPDGNLTQDGKWNYQWDGENRLTRVESIDPVPPGVGKK